MKSPSVAVHSPRDHGTPVSTQILGLVVCLAVCFAAGGVGALGSAHAAEFYASLAKPEWAPPGWVFGPVWSILYLFMGVAAWLVWRRGGVDRSGGALPLFLVQLGCNALWTWLFFAWRQGASAFAEILLLWALVTATMVLFWRVRPLAGLLMVPYLAWVTFATALCHALWRANPHLLG